MAYPTRKERQRKKRSKRRSPWKVILSLFILILLALAGLGYYGYTEYESRLEPVNAESEESIEVEIPFNSSMQDISQILEDNQIIQDARVFNFYTRLKSKDNIQAGFYQLSPSSSVPEIADQLQEGGADVSQEAVGQITIPEGYNVVQIVDVIDQNTDFSSDEALALLEDEAFIQSLYEQYPELLEGAIEAKDETIYTFEGYLYPATYEIHDEMTLEELITAMVDKAHAEYSAYYEEIAQSEYDVHDVLTIASFVEAEANNDEDRRLIAGVFLNRLAIDMPLQTDVSVGYANGEHLEYTTLEDADIDSPYNLYRNTGIGPGPNNNASVNSVDAVLHPEESDYLYFLADINTEETYFSETFEEHLEKQAIYVDRTAEPPSESETEDTEGTVSDQQ